MTNPLYLYLVKIGTTVKVGVSDSIHERVATHRNAARKKGLEFEVLAELPRHHEASQNERAIVRRFAPPGSRSEYLSVDAEDVLDFLKSLPCTPVPRPEAEWLTRYQAAERLRSNVRTVDRWVQRGILPCYQFPSGRARFKAEDVDLLAIPRRVS